MAAIFTVFWNSSEQRKASLISGCGIVSMVPRVQKDYMPDLGILARPILGISSFVIEKPETMRKIYSRIEDELDEKFGLACVKRRLSRPKGVIAAIEMWMSAATPGTPQKWSGQTPIVFPASESAEFKTYRDTFSSPENRRLLEMLLVVLKTGDPDAIAVVTSAIKLVTPHAKAQGPEPDSTARHRRGKG